MKFAKFIILTIILAPFMVQPLKISTDPTFCVHNCTNTQRRCASSKKQCKYNKTEDYTCSNITYNCPKGFECN